MKANSPELHTLTGKVKTTLNDSLERVQETELFQEVQSGTKILAKEAAKYIRKHPLESVAAAAAVGFVAGILISRRRG